MTLNNIKGIKWVGALSDEDADTLAMYGKQSSNVLEFGAGGSTLILAQTSNTITTVENIDAWRDATRKRLKLLSLNNVIFYKEGEYKPYGDIFDLIFVDGERNKRYNFAVEHWLNLKPGGVMIFHDTTRHDPPYLRDALNFYSNVLPEADKIDINPVCSNGVQCNLTIIRKSKTRPFYDWTLNRERWTLGDLETFDKFYEVDK